jgi:2-aminoadipate transaminase
MPHLASQPTSASPTVKVRIVPMPADPTRTDLALPLSARARRAVDQPISYLMTEALRRPGLISLAAGFVDYDTLPTAAMRRLCDELLADDAEAKIALQYGTTLGLPALREALFEHMARLDGRSVTPGSNHSFPGSPEQVVVSTGSQQLLHLIADLLIDPGDIVLTGYPSYFVFTGALSAFGPQVRGIPLDEHGLQPDALEALLDELDHDGQLPRVKMLYLCTHHQNPTGLSLSAARKQAIYDLIVHYSQKAGRRILILDDAAYRELTYEGDASASLKTLDTDNQYVALLQTFSKPFAPGLKTGYGLLPDDLIEPITLNKGGRDFGSSNLIQCLLDRALRTGVYAEQVETVCAGYRAKRDAMLEALDEHLGALPGVSWTRPTGGLYIWLTLPDHLDTGRHGDLFRAALDAGTLFVPGEYCFPDDPTRDTPRHHLRLSFGVPNPQQIRAGIERLARAIHAHRA